MIDSDKAAIQALLDEVYSLLHDSSAEELDAAQIEANLDELQESAPMAEGYDQKADGRRARGGIVSV